VTHTVDCPVTHRHETIQIVRYQEKCSRLHSFPPCGRESAMTCLLPFLSPALCQRIGDDSIVVGLINTHTHTRKKRKKTRHTHKRKKGKRHGPSRRREASRPRASRSCMWPLHVARTFGRLSQNVARGGPTVSQPTCAGCRWPHGHRPWPP